MPIIENPASNGRGTGVYGTWYEDNSTLWPGERMYKGRSLYSRSGQYRLTMQWDGNLVLYRHNRPDACWHTHTVNHPGAWAVMQFDGNFVVYDEAAPSEGDPRSWYNTGTVGNPGSYITVQNDGNVVIYRPNGSAAWASWTVGC